MSPALRAELFKQRTTRTSLNVLVALLGIVLFVVLIHGLGLSADGFVSSTDQITNLLAWGEVFGALFAGLLGAMSITGEIRHGTIRPTFLITPERRRVISAKVGASVIVGTGFGLAAGALAAGAGTIALRSRGIDVRVDAGDYALLLTGGAVASGLWAAIGVGVGAVVRNQVPALVGITIWLLFVENLLVGDVAGVGDIGPFLPGAAAKAISGQDPSTLLAPGIALVVLVLYAAASAMAGSHRTARRDAA